MKLTEYQQEIVLRALDDMGQYYREIENPQYIEIAHLIVKIGTLPRKAKRYRICLRASEKRILLHALNELRSRLLQLQLYTDIVDEIIGKIYGRSFSRQWRKVAYAQQ